MTDSNLTEDVAKLREELLAAGIKPATQPEDLGFEFRSASSFTDGRRAKHKLGRRLAVGALVAAAATAFIFILGPLSRDHVEQPQFTTAAQILDAAGEADSGIPGGKAATAKYLFVESVIRQGTDQPVHRRVWLGHFGEGLLDEGGSPAPIEKANFGLQRSDLSWDQIVGLPSDVAGLTRLLREEAGQGPDANWLVFKMAGELLSDAPTTLAVRKSLWAVLGSLDGITEHGKATDSQGREGRLVAIGDTGRGTLTYLVDIQDGLLLETRLDPSPQSGRDRYVVTYIEQELSSAPAGQTP